MAQLSKIPQDLMTNSLLHFQQGVPIDDLKLTPPQKRRLMRVSHVYWQWAKNPMLSPQNLALALIRQGVGGKRYADPQAEWHAAEKDKWLFDFIVEQVAPPSRRQQEAKVRYAADRLMEMGLATDNGRDIAEGAKLAIKIDRLDQPEDQHQDISRVAFLPSVVVTDIREVDDTKEYIDDEETRRIAAKYGAHIDEKRTMVEEQVATMEARAGIGAENPNDYEQNRQ